MSDKDKKLTQLKTKPMERNIAIAKMGLGAGARIAVHSVGNLFRSDEAKEEANKAFYAEQAAVMAHELGQLKGSVMKAGQMLSVYGQYFLPEEAVDVLSSLQDSTQPVSWSLIEPQLVQALGHQQITRLDIDREPLAAASLGQAHRARLTDTGEEVVVKIQYPGVSNSIDSDLKTLSRLLMTTRMVPKQLDLEPVFSEVRDMLVKECDYFQERRYTETFAEKLQDDRRFIVPKVYGEFCAERVLTTRYEHGFSVKSPQVAALSQQRRNALGHAFVDLFIREFFDWRMVQTDPHFGNYRIRINEDRQDQIVVLDFGATRQYRPEFLRDYSMIVRGGLTGDVDEIIEGALRIRLMDRGTPRKVLEEFADLAKLIVEPFRHTSDPNVPSDCLSSDGMYRFGSSNLPTRVAQKAAMNAMTVHFRIPPREIVFLHRRIGGVFATLTALNAELDLGPVMEELLLKR